MKHLRQALTSNGYPNIKALIHHHSMQFSSRTVDRNDTQGPVVILSYVQGVSEEVRHILTPLGAKVSFCPHTALRHLLMRPKDRAAKRVLTGVVYQVPCAGCPAIYVGQTSRRLNKRLSEHKRAVESGEAATSALAEHAWGHTTRWIGIRSGCWTTNPIATRDQSWSPSTSDHRLGH